eukprot:CCRYP_000824-RA/>CCRYP_000824-RA protein AED:0.27 eAED:0.34 QI:0/0/0/1/0/0/5/0/237
MNEKGGMDDIEFQEYFLNSIVPLFPDSNNVKGKRVMVKVDKGPGRLQEDFSAEARTDLLCNLEYQTQQQLHKRQIKTMRVLGTRIILPPYLVGLIVFGGVDPVSKVAVSDSAFELAFSKEQNCEVWKKVGAAPLTQSCLKKHNQIPRKMGDAKDAANNTMRHTQTTNDLSRYFLKEHGFNSDVLKVSIKRLKNNNSQERIDAISKATTHGNLFHETGGGHLSDHDVFLALQKKKVEA